MKKVLAFDIGTTGVKTCVFEIDSEIELLGSESAKYPLYVLPDGGAEQEADDWWNAMCMTSAAVLEKTGTKAEEIAAISFCSQMQGVVLVDKDGNAVRRPMSYMDQRATEEIKKGIAHGVQIAGAQIGILLKSLVITGAVTSSVKDPVWKYKWIEAHEPENFKRAYKWFDVKDYLICRCTGAFKVTEDSAFATLIYDTRKNHKGWSKTLCRQFKIKEDLLAPIIKSTDVAGTLTVKAAEQLSLVPGIPVFGGGGDSSLIGVGAGSVKKGDTHIYSGTSGWVITVTDKQMVDVGSMIAAITGAVDGKFNYFAEMETAGKSLDWIRELLGKDVTGSSYEKLDSILSSVPAGSNGLLFAPWLHGNRCPFEDPSSSAVFLGLKLETTKEEMVKAVLEGVFYHLRWMYECEAKKIKVSNPVRFVGGGALSKQACQMLADILGVKVETPASVQNAGAVGAAAVCAVGLGLISSIEEVGTIIPAVATYEPDAERHAQYEKPFTAFKKLYEKNKKIFGMVKND